MVQQPQGHTWSPQIPKQLDLSHLLWVWEPLGSSKACSPGTRKSSAILQALPFHSFLSLLKNPTWAGAAVCGFKWGTTFKPKKAFSKITVFFNGGVELSSFLWLGSLWGPVNIPWCQHKGTGGSSRGNMTASISERLQTMLWAGLWLTPVCISCTEKSSLHSTASYHQSQPWQVLNRKADPQRNHRCKHNPQHTGTDSPRHPWICTTAGANRHGDFIKPFHTTICIGAAQKYKQSTFPHLCASQLQHPAWAPRLSELLSGVHSTARCWWCPFPSQKGWDPARLEQPL